jgi:Flp pilus assembly CpaF family ATPase
VSKHPVRGGEAAGLPERSESLNTVRMAGARRKPVIRLVAHHAGAEIHLNGPRGSAELSETGGRFEGMPPPIVAPPAFAIRTPAVAIFMLEDCHFRADFENSATTWRKIRKLIVRWKNRKSSCVPTTLPLSLFLA